MSPTERPSQAASDGDKPLLKLFADDPPAPLASADGEVQSLLEAWHTATVRLEQTHLALHAEVARLNDELECKNRELARKNRLADLGQMASHVAHEVKNSLVPVTLNLSLLRRRLRGDAEALETLAQLEAGFQSLDATVNDLLSFTAHREPHRTSFLVCSLVEEVVDSLTPQCDAQGVEVEIDIPPNTVLTGDREMIRRAVLNLALNALDVMPGGGALVITSYDGVAAFELEVADTGPGVSEQQRRKLFEPFYSTKQTGTGLGLAIVDHVCRAHGGTVTVTNCPEGGAAFTLCFPRQATMGAAA